MKNLMQIMLIVGIGVVLSVCHKPTTMEQNNGPESSKDFEEMEVKDHFQWKTLKDVSVTLTSETDVVVQIQSDKGNVYMKAFVKAGEAFESKITIPTYVTEVTLASKSQTYNQSVIDKKIEKHFN